MARRAKQSSMDAYGPEYSVWRHMRERCRTTNRPDAHSYTNRGIKVCDRWQSYTNFLSDMGSRPSRSHQIDRINNDGNYEPNNCRWVLSRINNGNTRRNVWVTIHGETLHFSAWCRSLGVSKKICSHRVSRGWTRQEALLTPVGPVGTRQPRRISAETCADNIGQMGNIQ